MKQRTAAVSQKAEETQRLQGQRVGETRHLCVPLKMAQPYFIIKSKSVLREQIFLEDKLKNVQEK